MTINKINLLQRRKPARSDINSNLQWISESLGLFTERDKERSCFRIFVELLKATRRQQALSSDQMALKTNLSRGTVIYHVTRLMDAGIVIAEHNKYVLRSHRLEELIAEIQKDVLRIFDNMRETAARLDAELGLDNK